MVTRVKANFCTCDHCGHSWLSEVEPLRCAKCKRRTWNEGGHQAPLEKITRRPQKGLRRVV